MKASKTIHMLIWVVLTALMCAAIPANAANEVKIATVGGAPTTPVTLELKAADIRDVLQLLAKLSGINVVADKSVSGEVSVSLNEVPFDQALDMVIRANGFTYRWVGDVLLVAAADRMVEALEEPVLRTFNLQYLDPADAVTAVSLVVDRQNIVADSGSRTLIVKAIPSQLTTVAKLIESLDVSKTPASQSMLTKVLTVRHTDPQLVVEALKDSLGSGALLVPRNKAVVFRGTQDQLALVTDLLETIDRPELASPSEQTVSEIEEKPAEVLITKVINLSHMTSEGAIQALSLVVPPESLKVIQENRQIAMRGTEQQIAEGLRIIGEIDRPAYQVLIEARVEEISVSALRSMGIDWTLYNKGLALTHTTDITTNNFSLGKGGNLGATLKTLEENGDSTVLANPRVTVLDGEQARIHIGDKIPIIVDTKDVDAEGKVTITRQVEYIDVGIILEVLPRINNEGFITAVIKPEVSTIVDQLPQGYPQIRTRSANTRMTLTNGETIVLGGLLQEDEVENIRKVPVLSSLPVLGKLFQTKTTDTKQTEIVIFLTPTIMPVEAK